MLAIVTPFFNPCGWQNRLRNLIEFRKHLPSVDLFVIEVSFDKTFVFDDSIHVHGCDANRWIWQKERLINLAVERLPLSYDKIAWIDGDLLFENHRFVSDAESTLDSYDVVQLFESAHYLDDQGGVIRSVNSVCSQLTTYPNCKHVGFAWAARREMFPLHDTDVIGGGDLTMACRWLANADIKVGCIPGEIRHLYHGSIQDRRYNSRSHQFGATGFHPETDLEISKNGLWKWTGNNPEAERFAEKYLKGRREDTPHEHPAPNLRRNLLRF